MPTNAEYLRLQFWTEFKGVAEARGIAGLPGPTPLSQCDVLLGRSGFKVAMTFRVQGNCSGWPPIGVGCELYIDHPDAKTEFGKLETKKNEIEDALGKLEWMALPQKDACRIAQYYASPVQDREEWPV